MSLTIRKAVVLGLIGLILLLGNILLVANWLAERGVVDWAQRIRTEYLTGTAITIVGPCTAKTTIYCANVAAGLMVAQFTKYLRQLLVEADIQLNLLASELSVV